MSLVRRISTYAPRPVIKHPAEGGVGLFLRALFLLACAVGTAACVFFSYPSQSYSFLAWVAWVPFFCGIFSIQRARTAFLYGWFTAFLFNAGIFYWIYYTCVHGGGMSTALSVGAWWGLSGLLALQGAFFGAGCFFLKKTGWLFALLAACGYVTLEWLHQLIAFYGLGFPWMMWGQTQWNVPAILQVASWTGVYGISFLLILVSAFISLAFYAGRIERFFGFLFCAAAVWFGTFWWGGTQLPLVKEPHADTLILHASLVQPNIDQYKKWDPLFDEEIRQTLETLGTEAAEQEPQLIVWPENVTPGALTEEPYWTLMQEIGQKSGAYQLVGSAIFQDKMHVGAYLLTPGEETPQAYLKHKLVPFGEYIPLEKFIRKTFKDIKVLGELGLFTPGPAHQNLLAMGEVLLGTTICYESIFPQLWRGQAKQGARFFVNISNDAWFFDTAAPHQHLAANVLRAVENGLPVLRATNTGISAVIDPQGRINKKTELFEQRVLEAEAALPPAASTFYAKWGDVFAWICAVLFFTVLIYSVVFMYE